MVIGLRCLASSGTNGERMSRNMLSTAVESHSSSACHFSPTVTRARQPGRLRSWFNRFSQQSHGRGRASPRCLGHSACMVWGFRFNYARICHHVDRERLRSSFCSRLLFTCISSACFAGSHTLDQLNTNWVEQMLDLFNDGVEASLKHV